MGRRANHSAYYRQWCKLMDRGSAYDILVFECRTYQQRISPDWSVKFHGHRADPVDVINGYISRAIRRGLTGEQIRCAMAEAGLVMPVGVMTLGRLLTLDLSAQKDSWVRYWCNVIPRVLVCATRGELDGAELAGRVYKDSEIKEVLPLCVTAQAEDLQLWSRLAAWACDELYPEYERRADREHKCQQRTVECTYLYPAEW